MLTGGGGKSAASKKDKDKLVVDLGEAQIEGQHQFDEDFEDPAGFGREEGLEEVGADEVHLIEQQVEGVVVMNNDDDDDDQFLVGGRPRAASQCVDEPVPVAAAEVPARSLTLTRSVQLQLKMSNAKVDAMLQELGQPQT